MIGETAVVVDVLGGNHQYRQRLFAAGVIPGATLTLAQKAPFGDLVKVITSNGSVALRAAEAAVIKIKKLASE